MNSERIATLFTKRVLLLFLASTAVMLLTMKMWVNPYDEGIILTGAMRAEAGDLPHRDFYANYGLANFYVLAGLFKLFGQKLIVARAYDTIVRALIVAATFALLRRSAQAKLVYAGVASVAVWMIGSGFYLYPMFAVILIILFQLLVIGRDAEFPRPRNWFVAGILTGLIALIRYDVGFLVLLAHLAASLSFILLGRQRLSTLVRPAVAYLLGTTLAFGPVAVATLAAGILPYFVNDLISFSVKYYSPMRSLPWPGFGTLFSNPSEIAVYVPFLALIVAGAVAFRQFAAGKGVGLYVLLLGSLVAAMAAKGMVRPTSIHMLAAIILSIPLLIECARIESTTWTLSRAAGLLLALLFASGLVRTIDVIGGLTADPGSSLAGDMLGLKSAGPRHAFQVDRMRYGRMRTDDVCAAELVVRNSRASERVFVANGRHDRTVLNNVALYFAMGRLPATHWHHFDPGLQTRADIQRAIAAELERGRTRWVVVDRAADDFIEPNASGVSSGVFLLDRYIAANFAPIADYGRVSVLLRRNDLSNAPAILRSASDDCAALGAGKDKNLPPNG